MKTTKKPVILIGALLLAVSVGGGAQEPPKTIGEDVREFSFTSDTPGEMEVILQGDGSDSPKDSKLSKEDRAKLSRELESLAKERAKLDAKIQGLRSKLGGRMVIRKSITVGPNGHYLVEPKGGHDILLTDPNIQKEIRIHRGFSDQDRMKLDKEMKELRIEMKRSGEGHHELLIVPKFGEAFKGSFVLPKGDFAGSGGPQDKVFFFKGENSGDWKAWSEEHTKALKEWHEQFGKAMKEWQEKHGQMLKEWSERSEKMMKEWSERRQKLQGEKLKELEKKKGGANTESKPSSASTNSSQRAI